MDQMVQGQGCADALLAAMRTVWPEYAMLSSIMAATLAHSDVVCCRRQRNTEAGQSTRQATTAPSRCQLPS
eukprot:SAG25_NODE_8882_length_398_cov_1.364548_1_plen_70_part_10